MLSIRTVDPSAVVILIGDLPLTDYTSPGEWETYCKDRGVFVLVAEEEGNLVGWAVAESSPRCLYILRIEGDTATCRLLLGRLVRVAGERDLGGWVAHDRPAVRRLFQRLGFVKGGRFIRDGVPSVFYYWDRNADL
jgi:L-amino acid N-acyltransferase YncA